MIIDKLIFSIGILKIANFLEEENISNLNKMIFYSSGKFGNWKTFFNIKGHSKEIEFIDLDKMPQETANSILK